METGWSWKQTIRMFMWGVCVLIMVSTLMLPAHAKDKSGVLKASELLKMKVQGTAVSKLGAPSKSVPKREGVSRFFWCRGT